MKPVNQDKPAKISPSSYSAQQSTSFKHHSEASPLTGQFRDASNRVVWWSVFGTVLVVTAIVRFYKLHFPARVCWDETHFVRHASHYVVRKFFYDVHPPLGKLLIAFFGYLGGFEEEFFNDVGTPYKDVNVPYIGMRLGCALLGAMTVPLCFLTVWETTRSLPASTFTAMFLVFDNAMTTLNRFILLDPFMLFFISATVFCTVKFRSWSDRPFAAKWWFWLAATGTFMTGAIGIKFVGLFCVLLVGCRTINELWEILGDLSKPVSYTVKHFIARAICLIVLPVLLYMAIFYVHLRVGYKTGLEDEFFSSAFQVSIEGSEYNRASAPREVAFGAQIRLKNDILEGQFLHSHRALYPVGAQQQQITMLPIADPNNRWLIKRHDQPAQPWNSTDPIEFVRHGDLIRLEHRTTKRNLHVHRGPAPISHKLYQVTGYGWKGEGDDDDIWRLEIERGTPGEILETLHKKFRLIHVNNKCALTTTDYNYPEWGFGQTEVACHPKLHDDYAVWMVDDNVFPRLPNVSYKAYELSFVQRFIESHAKMLTGNSAFKPKISDFVSRPWMWPLNLRGQFFSVEQEVLYLLGNPFVWWGHCLYFIFYFILWIVDAVDTKRNSCTNLYAELRKRSLRACNWTFIGFLWHYVPFWPMTRILYVHHYYPALIFSNIISGVMLDYILETFLSKIKSIDIYPYVVGVLLAVLGYTFYLFSPLTYGYPNRPSIYNDSQMYGMKWLPTWEF